jgi:hypothetical protein
MALVHTKSTYWSINAVDISTYCNASDFERGADEHDVTCYGVDDHVVAGGLGNGKTTIGGLYDTAAGGPRATIEPLIGTVVALVHRPAGTGTGKPQDTVNVLVKNYKESAPVADYVRWSADLTHSGAVTTANQ